jgi:ABC-type lipoprotein release transport system permease subunit
VRGSASSNRMRRGLIVVQVALSLVTLTLAIVAIVLLAVTLAACYLAARRVTTIEPERLLREG